MKLSRVAPVLASAMAMIFLAASAGTAAPAGNKDGQFASRVLAIHNVERSRLGLGALRWNGRLAEDAETWARKLAGEGRFYHSDQRINRGAGENLWKGTASRFSTDDMIGAFVEERRHFRPGEFPYVSHTGRWEDVGHYTQIIWPSTREVGCAVAQGHGSDVLVCRYWPAGNWIGEPVG